jgi:hypothetical protein
MPTEYISEMLKHIQNSLKQKTNLSDGMYEIWEREPPNTMKGGSDTFHVMKGYLDMVFDKEKHLKKEQQDSFERLTQIKKKAQQKKDEKTKEREFKEENELLAQNQQAIEMARVRELEVEKKAMQLQQRANEAVKQSEDAKQIIEEAKAEVDQTKLRNKMIYESIQTRKRSLENSDIIMTNLYKKLENRELVSLEEIKEAKEVEEVIQEIQHKSISNGLEIKRDDILI